MFQLKKYFLLVGGAAFLFFTLAFIFSVYKHNLDTLEDFGERENTFVADILRELLAEQIQQYVEITSFDEIDLHKRPEIQQIETIIKDFSRTRPILKIKLFNLNGLTMYSTDQNEIGVQKENIF